MAKVVYKDLKEVKIKRPPRVKLSAKESLKRTQEFDKRSEQFVAAVRSRKVNQLYKKVKAPRGAADAQC
jgi:hypothetical protein